MNPELEELTQDDREILRDMLFPLFQRAGLNNKSLNREQIRLELANIFPWPHVAEVLRELEAQDYISLLSTRGGGLFVPGQNFAAWEAEENPLEAADEARAPQNLNEALHLSPEETAALGRWLFRLTEPAGGEELRAAVRQGLESPGSLGALIRSYL